MNHKLIMHKLEERRRDKLEQKIEIQKEISKIDTKIKEQKRLYLLSNKYSEEANIVLSGFSRENILELLIFFVPSLLDGDVFYRKAYKGIDIQKLIEDDNFFNFLIIQIGRATIEDMKKRFDKVVVVNGEELIETTAFGKALNSESFKHRLFKKLTKKSVLNEAKRITEESK